MGKLPSRFLKFQNDHRDIWQTYEALGATASKAGPLDVKTRELIKLGMAAAMRGESAVKSHTHRALEAGATPEEVEHAVVIGVTTIGFPNMMTALNWVEDAIEAHGQ